MYRYLCGFKNTMYTSTADNSLSQEKFQNAVGFRDEFWKTGSSNFAYAVVVRRLSELSATKNQETNKARFSFFVKLNIEPLFKPKYKMFSVLTKLVKRKQKEEKQHCADDDMDIVRRDISCSTSTK